MKKLRVIGALTVVAAGAALQSAPANAAVMVGYAWWNVANTGAVVPPASPDVGDGILVQGGSPSAIPGAPASSDPNASFSAIGAVAFDLSPDEFPDKVTLKISGQSPPTMGVVACPTRGAFPVEQNGAWSHVPAYDCSTQSVAILNPDAGTVTFNGLTAMVRGTRLSMVLLPGQLDRVVFQKPTTSSVAVTNTGGGPAYTGQRATPVTAPADTFTPPATGAAVTPEAPPVTEAPTTTPAPAPEVAAPVAATRTAAAQEKKDDSTSNRIAAAIALLLVVGVFVWIDRVRNLRAAVLAGARGIGRFTQDRTGPPPHL